MNKLWIIVTICVFSTITVSQELNLYGKQIIFGMSIEEFKMLNISGGQVESNYSYIVIYECDNFSGIFYDNKLIGISTGTDIQENQQGVPELEKEIADIADYKSVDMSNELGVAAFEYYYDTDKYLIKASVVRTQTLYDVYSKNLLIEVRTKHPEYAQEFL